MAAGWCVKKGNVVVHGNGDYIFVLTKPEVQGTFKKRECPMPIFTPSIKVKNKTQDRK